MRGTPYSPHPFLWLAPPPTLLQRQASHSNSRRRLFEIGNGDAINSDGVSIELQKTSRKDNVADAIVTEAIPAKQPSPMLLSDELQDEPDLSADPERICRLCFEIEPPELRSSREGVDKLIAPCECAGSMKWVHRSCLNQWRSHGQRHNMKAMSHCPTCAFEYHLYTSFDLAEDSRRRCKRRCLLARNFSLVFVFLQVILFLLASMLFCLDGSQVIPKFFGAIDKASWANFFRHQFFHYYSAAWILVFLLIGVATVGGCLVSACCPGRCACCSYHFPEPVTAYRRQGGCLQNCLGCCDCDAVWYDPLVWTCCDFPSCGGCDGFACGAVACEGEGALLLIGLALLALVLLGVFVALFMMSIAIQRFSQGYLRALHLRDVAERFVVADLSGASQIQAQADIQNISQESLRRKLQAEIAATRGYRPAGARMQEPLV